jgi:predicted Zn-ribbon and HTH transcriptional regulator
VFRKDLIELLLKRPLSIQQIARLLDERPRDVEDDLRHLLRSLKKRPYRAVVTPARCRKCGFRFHDDKLHKPGKCPRCHETWISEPLIEIRERTGGKG